MFTGPGPLACNLPTTVGTKGHTSTKPRAPAFSIGMPARGRSRQGQTILEIILETACRGPSRFKSESKEFLNISDGNKRKLR